MKIVIFGATGAAGQELVLQALKAGHEVTAVARKPASVTARHERLEVVEGDVTDAASMARAIAGQEAVALAVGPRPGTPPGTLISDATRATLDGMKQHGVKRLALVSGLMAGEAKGANVFKRGLISIFRSMNRALCDDKRKADAMVMASDLDWVIVRPPNFGEGTPRGTYRMGVDLDVSLSKMANRDVADGILAAVTGDEHRRKVLEISN